MATTTEDTKPNSTQQKAALASLTQQAAAALIGKPTIYFRDHAHEIPRNPDDSYNAAEVVRWALGQAEPAELPDEQLEALLQSLDIVSCNQDDDAFTFATLDAIVRQHGGAGLAAIGQVVFDTVKRWHHKFPCGAPDSYQPETRAEAEARLRPRYDRQLAKDVQTELAYQERYYARRTGKLVAKCECGAWRHGRKWRKTEIPPGHYVGEGVCPDCTAKMAASYHAR